jgi:uncharacterized protein (TIGR03435 family)
MMPRSFAGVAGVLADFAPALANHLWQSTVFAVVAGVLTLALRKNHARARYWLWMAASVKFLVPFALLIMIGSHLAKPHQAAATQAGMVVAMEDVSEPFALPDMPVVAAPVAKVDWAALLPVSCGVVWFGGFVGVLCLWTVRWRRVAAEMREAVAMREGRELDALRRLERASGIGARIRLLLSPGSMEPGVFGIARPVLAWPARISERLDDAHLAAVLAHEVCHVRRRDNLTAAIHMVVEAIFWFYPPVWWLGARLVEERERACDEEVLELCKQPEVYAESILKVCEFCVESPLACVSGVTGADLKQRIVEIMTERVVRKLGPGRKLLLVAVGLAVVAVPIVLGQVKAAQRMMLAAVDTAPMPFRAAAHAMIAEEQTTSTALIAELQPATEMQSDAKPIAFDVVSIRPAAPPANDGRPRRIGFQFTDDGFVATNQSLLMTLLRQYQTELQMGPNGIVGGPDWVRTIQWDIRAKVADSDIAEWSKLSHDSSAPAIERRNATLQAMLADRFKLKTHIETREGTVYALVVAKGGPKLKPLTSDAPTQIVMNIGPGHISSERMTIADVARFLTLQLGYHVIDKTGMTGDYDIALNWTPDQGAANASGIDTGTPSESFGPSIFTAVQEQLGLRLEAQKGQVEHLVIESAEKPSVDGAEVAQMSTAPVVPTQTSAAPVAGTAPAPATAAAKPIPFEVISIRKNISQRFSGLKFTPDGFSTEQSSVIKLLSMLGNIDTAALPGWCSTERYDIAAKIAESDIASWQKLGYKEKDLSIRTMLEDRFKLKLHIETKMESGFELVIAKNGSKLKEATPDETYPNGLKAQDGTPRHGLSMSMSSGGGVSGFSGQAATMEQLTGQLRMFTRTPVVDKTGLTGTYDFTLNAVPEPPLTAGDSTPPVTDGPSVFSAVQQQLGLKLESASVPVEYLVVDHIERPTEN